MSKYEREKDCSLDDILKCPFEKCKFITNQTCIDGYIFDKSEIKLSAIETVSFNLGLK